MTYTGPSFSFHVKYQVAPENVENFLAALKPVYDLVTVEPNCIFFEVYRSAEEPGLFRFVENWNATMEWLMNVRIPLVPYMIRWWSRTSLILRQVQLQKDYYKPSLAKIEPLLIKEREFEIWERYPGTEWVTVKKEMYQS